MKSQCLLGSTESFSRFLQSTVHRVILCLAVQARESAARLLLPKAKGPRQDPALRGKRGKRGGSSDAVGPVALPNSVIPLSE